MNSDASGKINVDFYWDKYIFIAIYMLHITGRFNVNPPARGLQLWVL